MAQPACGSALSASRVDGVASPIPVYRTRVTGCCLAGGGCGCHGSDHLGMPLGRVAVAAAQHGDL